LLPTARHLGTHNHASQDFTIHSDLDQRVIADVD